MKSFFFDANEVLLVFCYKWLTWALVRWELFEESRWGGWGLNDGLGPLKDGRGILDFRGGTGGTDFVVGILEILLLLRELLEIDGTMVLFNPRVWDNDVDNFKEGAIKGVLIGKGGWARPLVRGVVVGFFNDDTVGGGNFGRFIFILVMTVGLDFVAWDGVLWVEFDDSVRSLRNPGDGRGKSVSSKFNESDFEATDKELALRWSRWKKNEWIEMNLFSKDLPSCLDGMMKLLLIWCEWFPLVKWYWCP